jgi:hypothetical protein
MGTTTSPELTFEPGVIEYLRQHNLEAKFQVVSEAARARFPEARAIQVRLLEDPDEEDHTWTVLQVLLPASHPSELLRSQQRQYGETLLERLPLADHPFFGLTFRFMPE